MNYTITKPITDKDFEKYYYFRWEVLRKKLGGKLGTEKDDIESQSFHLYAKNNQDSIIAVGRLHLFNDDEDILCAQVRYMAVHHEYQKRGLGSNMLKQLESIAIKNKVNEIILHSRESAIDFYKKNNYLLVKKSHLLLNQIQHWLMKKKITY